MLVQWTTEMYLFYISDNIYWVHGTTPEVNLPFIDIKHIVMLYYEFVPSYGSWQPQKYG